MASNLEAMASNLTAMASNLIAKIRGTAQNRGLAEVTLTVTVNEACGEDKR